MRSDLTNKKFGRLLVVKFVGRSNSGDSVWRCRCDCGVYKSVIGSSLKSGNTKSCGCYSIDNRKYFNLKHGCAVGSKPTAEYRTWAGIIQRCTNRHIPVYRFYGGRGITVCDRWSNSFVDFLEDVGLRPTEKHSLDRFPNQNGNYEPGNVRWATQKEQMRNRRSNRIIEYMGKKDTMVAWSEKFGLRVGLVWGRIHRGWSVEKALSTPVKRT